MDYDPMQYRGSAQHNLAGRPPYSAEPGTLLARELGLDGTGQKLDVGCGPGVLAVQLAALVARVTALDPDLEMLEQARTHAASSGVRQIGFIQARAEDIADLGLAPMRTVTFADELLAVEVPIWRHPSALRCGSSYLTGTAGRGVVLVARFGRQDSFRDRRASVCRRPRLAARVERAGDSSVGET